MLERETGLLVARLRVFTPARYAATAAPFPSRADAARHLAGRLATAGLQVEAAADPSDPPELPELPDLALADQIAVTGHDLVAALRATPPDRPVTGRTAAAVAADLLAEVLLHRHDVDGAAPGRRVAAAVLSVLAPGTTPDRFLAVARSRCPASY